MLPNDAKQTSDQRAVSIEGLGITLEKRSNHMPPKLSTLGSNGNIPLGVGQLARAARIHAGTASRRQSRMAESVRAWIARNIGRLWNASRGARVPIGPRLAIGRFSKEPLEPQTFDQADFVEQNVSTDSRLREDLQERDPNNRWLARGPRFRLDAEELRDLALASAGLLHNKVGGASTFPPVPESVLEYNYVKPAYWKPATGPERYRRSLYVFKKRSMPDPVLTTLDAPNGDTACARRPRSNTPLAALLTLNETVFVESARAMSLRILKEAGPSDVERIDYAYQLCMSRVANEKEKAAMLQWLASQRERIAEGWLSPREISTGDAKQLPALPPNATPQDAAVWTLAARVLLNLDEAISKN